MMSAIGRDWAGARTAARGGKREKNEGSRRERATRKDPHWLRVKKVEAQVDCNRESSSPREAEITFHPDADLVAAGPLHPGDIVRRAAAKSCLPKNELRPAGCPRELVFNGSTQTVRIR